MLKLLHNDKGRAMINLGGLFSKNSGSQKPNSRLRKSILGDGQAVISAITDGVVAIGGDSNIYIMNSAAEELLGWSDGDARNLKFSSVLKIVDSDGKEISETTNPINRALEDYKPFSSQDIHLKTQSGKIFPARLTINPINDEQTGIVAVFRDISQELKENREQAEFISTASHEMRTPVASIEGYLGLSLNPETATIDARAREYITKAHESTQHLGRLFQDLLDITKAEDGQLKNNPRVVNTTDFVKKLWEGFRVNAEEKNLKYVFEPDIQKGGEKQLAPVFFSHADKDHLREVIDNLIENAVKYTHQGGVSVNVSGDNEKVEISVRDSGIGIPAEDISHLFQKFYRVDNSDTREIGGTGLGLYLSRRLVESMGGKITVESEYKKGSTFTISLPRLSSEEARRLQEQQDRENWNTSETPIEEVKLTNKDFEPVVAEKVQAQKTFSAADIAAKVRKEMLAGTQNQSPAAQQSQSQPQPQAPSAQQPPSQPQQPPQFNPNMGQQAPVASAPAPTNPVPNQPANQIMQQSPAINSQIQQQNGVDPRVAQPNPVAPTQNQPRPPQQTQALPNPSTQIPQTQPSQLQVAELTPQPRPPVRPTNPPRQPTLSDIEKMKENYIKQMAAERQKQV